MWKHQTQLMNDTSCLVGVVEAESQRICSSMERFFSGVSGDRRLSVLSHHPLDETLEVGQRRLSWGSYRKQNKTKQSKKKKKKKEEIPVCAVLALCLAFFSPMHTQSHGTAAVSVTPFIILFFIPTV